jgi:hypothetical protein
LSIGIGREVKKTMNLSIDKELQATICVCAACAGITVIEVYALHMGVNGIFMASSLAALAGLGGYKLKALNG